MRNTLTFDQRNALAILLENAGYHLLLDALQADCDNLLIEIENAESDETERRLVCEWRATRRVLAKFFSLPQEMAVDVAAEQQELNPLLPFAPETEEDLKRMAKFYNNDPRVTGFFNPEE